MAQLLVGTYTRSAPDPRGTAEGILALEVHGSEVGVPALAATTTNPSWLCASRDGRNIYSVVETSAPSGGGGEVIAFERDRSTSALVELGSTSSGGGDPAHLALDPTERFVVVTNYGSGSVSVLARKPSGELGPLLDLVQHDGAGPDLDRQSAPHPHQTVFDPRTGFALVPDLGLDRVFIYELTREGTLVERPDQVISLEQGAGPRHVAFHPNGDHLFVLNELHNTLQVLRRKGARFVATDLKSTVPEDFSLRSQAGEVCVSASGRVIFASNRGHDSIAVFRFDERESTIHLAGIHSAGGREPRHFISSPDGSFLLVACQKSDTVVSLGVDERGYSLQVVHTQGVPTPVCLLPL